MNIYFEQKILNADPIELTRIVYARAIHCVREAREHLARRRIIERATSISRAYAAISELQGALRREAAPELAGRLEDLYLYIQRLLIKANSAQADQPLAESLALLTTLAEGWNNVKREPEPREEALQRRPDGSVDHDYREAAALTA